jgi:hypothetical protein
MTVRPPCSAAAKRTKRPSSSPARTGGTNDHHTPNAARYQAAHRKSCTRSSEDRLRTRVFGASEVDLRRGRFLALPGVRLVVGQRFSAGTQASDFSL